jgi:hypothetical protein
MTVRRLVALVGLLSLSAAPAAPSTGAIIGLLTDPPDTATTGASFAITGAASASPPTDPRGTDVDAVHIWAYPDGGGAPMFIGAATLFTTSPSGSAGGATWGCACGWFTITASGLAAGGYTLVASAHQITTGEFGPFASSRITVAATPPTVMTVTRTIVTAPAAGLVGAPPQTAVAYDDKHDVFLEAWEDGGNVVGRFVGFDGTMRGGAFTLSTNRITTARLPIVAYSRGIPDDAFVVLYQSDANAAGTGQNVFAQIVRFTGQGATGGAMGLPIPVSTASLSAAQKQVPRAVVFNPVSGQFLLVWDEFPPTAPQLSTVQLRHLRPDGIWPAAAVTLPASNTSTCGSGPDTDVSALAASVDWRHDRYVVSYTRSLGGINCHHLEEAKYLALDATTLSALPVSGFLCQAVIECTADASGTYVADSDAVLLNWTHVFPFDPSHDVVGSLLGADGTFRNGPIVLGPTQVYGLGDTAYDPDAGRGVVVGTARKTAGSPLNDQIVAALIGPDGVPLTTALALSADTDASRPAMVDAHDGAFAISYATATDGVILQVLQVPTGQPGLHLSNVAGNLDGPTGGLRANMPFDVLGWAIDFGASSGTGIDAVHAWAFPAGGAAPIFLGATERFVQRGDLAALFGVRFGPSGFQITASGLPPGTYTIAAYPHTALTGQFSSARLSTITVAEPVSQPLMWIDLPTAHATVGSGFDIGGWAIDRSAASGGGVDVVHVWAFPSSGGAPIFLGATPVDRLRPDVAAIFGPQFVNAGYQLPTAPLAPGQYFVVAYAHSTVTGTFNNWQVTDVTVRPPGDPLLVVDTPSDGATLTTPFTLAGWAIDRDATADSGVDGVEVWESSPPGTRPFFVGFAQLGQPRADVAAVFGPQFANAGYSIAIAGLPKGQCQLIVRAHSTVSGKPDQLHILTVTVQ